MFNINIQLTFGHFVNLNENAVLKWHQLTMNAGGSIIQLKKLFSFMLLFINATMRQQFQQLMKL